MLQPPTVHCLRLVHPPLLACKLELMAVDLLKQAAVDHRGRFGERQSAAAVHEAIIDPSHVGTCRWPSTKWRGSAWRRCCRGSMTFRVERDVLFGAPASQAGEPKVLELGHVQVGDGHELGAGAETAGGALWLLQETIHGFDVGIATVVGHAPDNGVEASFEGGGELLGRLQPAAQRPAQPGRQIGAAMRGPDPWVANPGFDLRTIDAKVFSSQCSGGPRQLQRGVEDSGRDLDLVPAVAVLAGDGVAAHGVGDGHADEAANAQVVAGVPKLVGGSLRAV